MLHVVLYSAHYMHENVSMLLVSSGIRYLTYVHLLS